MHVFYVQGGGLGHLTRIDKLIRLLNINPLKVIIISPSSFTHYFKRYTFKMISWNESVEDWTKTISKTLLKHSISSFYIDAFPLGLKGELISIYKKFNTIDYVYISRILKWETYLINMATAYLPVFSKTLILEHLYPQHYLWITQNSKQIETIDLTNLLLTNKSLRLTKEPYVLIVHSGGKKEVLELCNIVEKDKEIVFCKVIVCTQVSLNLNSSRFSKKSTYPVSQYFKYAEKIYTAAGFNSIFELKKYKEKHVSIAFNKLYDDQAFRISDNKYIDNL